MAASRTLCRKVGAMSQRAYILLQTVEGKAEHVAQALRRRPGVMVADSLDGPPDVIMVVEAPGRTELAELTVQALSSVETMTADVWLLPAR